MNGAQATLLNQPPVWVPGKKHRSKLPFKESLNTSYVFVKLMKITDFDLFTFW
ncbi:hypothetical protein I79_005536 [Cricetulus griseus]|uniref:Uncharacterized protein n=1 Tax=Cricetulus griseus TaxID=10029 RepID=G3H5F5_CRIGR|nr:hypothetical protein I79_005536 [Cricetulus griseus]